MATTQNTPVPIRTQASTGQMDTVLDLSKYLAGTKTTTGQTTTAQTAPLEALIAQMMDPRNLESLVANLFQQGAAQVPALTSQFANATGTRTGSNTMLSQSLAALNQSIVQAIAQAAVQQQGQAAQAAGQLAQSTRGVQQTQRTAPGSLLRAAVPTVVGSILNKIGKAQGTTTSPTEAPVSTDVLSLPQTGGELLSPEIAPAISDFGGAFETIDQFSNVFSTPDLNAFEGTTDIVDYDFGAFDGVDIADAFSGFDAPDLGFFRDGGRIGRRYGAARRNYADGGEVRPVRNIPNFGPRIGPTRTASLRIAPQSQSLQTQMSRRRQGMQEQTGEGPEGISANAAGPTGGVSSSQANTIMGIAMGLPSIMSLAMAPTPVLMEALVTKALVNQVKNLMQEAINLPMMPPAVIPSIDTLTTETTMPAAITPSIEAHITTDIASPESFGFGDVGSGGFGDTEGIGATTGIGGESATGGVGDGDSGVGDAASAGVGGGGYRDGGKVKTDKSKLPPYKGDRGTGKNPPGGIIRGEGTTTSDSIDIAASIGEYVLPASTVAALGKDLLDSIVAATHTPAGRGTHG